VCQYDAAPLYKWFSSTDATDAWPGLTCVPVTRRPPGSSGAAWYNAWKIFRLIDAWPW
jgi:hypothetical protein